MRWNRSSNHTGRRYTGAEAGCSGDPGAAEAAHWDAASMPRAFGPLARDMSLALQRPLLCLEPAWSAMPLLPCGVIKWISQRQTAIVANLANPRLCHVGTLPQRAHVHHLALLVPSSQVRMHALCLLSSHRGRQWAHIDELGVRGSKRASRCQATIWERLVKEPK